MSSAGPERSPPRLPPVIGALVLALAGFPLHAGAAGVDTLESRTDADTGLSSWHWQGAGLSLELTQLLPAQTRAFFMGRGFGAQPAETIAERCVFQAVLRNTHPEDAIDLDLARWHSLNREDERPLVLNHHWQEKWQKQEVREHARIAFRWALFPSEHRFEPGDWLMGMLVFDHAPGTRFDLQVQWEAGNAAHHKRLDGLQCAPSEAS